MKYFSVIQNKWTIDTYQEDESQVCFDKEKKPYFKSYALYNSICMMVWNRYNYKEGENVTGDQAGGLGEEVTRWGGWGEWWNVLYSDCHSTCTTVYTCKAHKTMHQ